MEATSNGQNTILEIKCSMCKEKHRIVVETSDWNRYEDTEEHIQDIFPYLNADQREMIISGVCGACFDALYDLDEDEPEDMPESYEYNNRD